MYSVGCRQSLQCTASDVWWKGGGSRGTTHGLTRCQGNVQGTGICDHHTVTYTLLFTTWENVDMEQKTENAFWSLVYNTVKLGFICLSLIGKWW